MSSESNASNVANMAQQQREMSKQSPGPVELQSLSNRQYLDETVVPLLLEGLAILAKVRYYKAVFSRVFINLLNTTG